MIIIDQLMRMPALYAVIIVSFFVSLLINIAYKFMTNQKRLKEIREETKRYQEKMKEHKGDTKKVMQIQKDSMKLQMEMFKQTMKPTLITMLPLIFIFAWMNAHFAYVPLMPGQEFTTTMHFKEDATGSAELIVPSGIELTGNAVVDISENQASWTLKGQKGDYLLQYKFDAYTFDKEILITQDSEYRDPLKKIEEDSVEQISIKHEKNILLNLPRFKIGWLGTYIIFSLVFSIVLRRLMGLY